MGTEEAALELIGLAYDAVLTPERWPVFMGRLASAMGARSAMLREVDYDAGSVGLFQEVATQRHRALSALDGLRVGVILLDGAGKPVHPKRAAAHPAKRLCLDAPSAGSMS